MVYVFFITQVICMSLSEILPFPLYVLCIKIFLANSYFVAILKSIFFSLDCLYIHCWHLEKALIFVYFFSRYLLF